MRLFLSLLLLASLTAAAGSLVEYTLYVRQLPGSPDGFPRTVVGVYTSGTNSAVVAADRPFPGPTIRAKLGDQLKVTVVNQFPDAMTSVHFHGFHNLNNPWMDGVFYITECGIAPGANLTYEFDVMQTGTYWYHSHTSVQHGDGLVGMVVIDYPELSSDPVYAAYPYTFDYPIMFQDWFHEPSNDLLVDLLGPYGAYANYSPHYPWPPKSVLINGRGQFNCDFTTACPPPVNCSAPDLECVTSRPPYFGPCLVNANHSDSFTCPANGYVRLRLIHGGSTSPVQFWIDRHKMIVVEKDGVAVKPRAVSFVALEIGERFDVIVHCNATAGGDPQSFYMFVSLAVGMIMGGPAPLIWYSALLSYMGATSIADPVMSMPAAIKQPMFYNSQMFAYQFRPLVDQTAPGAVERILLTTGFKTSTTPGSVLEVAVVNNATFARPKVPYLQAAYLGIPKAQFLVNQTGLYKNMVATNVIHLQQNKVYEIVILQGTTSAHPWHIHGYTVDVIAVGYFKDFNQTLPSQQVFSGYRVTTNAACNQTGTRYNADDIGPELVKLLPDFSLPQPVLLNVDTFMIPAASYIVLRIATNNPGPWFLHCHIEWHMASGQSVIISVGEGSDGTYRQSSIKPPPTSLQICGAVSTWGQAVLGVIPSSTSDQRTWASGQVAGLVVGFLALGFLMGFATMLVIKHFRNKRFVRLDSRREESEPK